MSRDNRMDIIYLNDLRVDTVIGIYEWERRTRQRVILDIEIGVDIRAAARTDNIENTLNYKAVAKRVIAFVSESRFQLVETLAESIAGIILNEFNVSWCRLRVNKQGAVKGVRDVGVIIERGTRD
jgi:7,8-dihydroneopterin aldolase/epimerase/oxygenase